MRCFPADLHWHPAASASTAVSTAFLCIYFASHSPSSSHLTLPPRLQVLKDLGTYLVVLLAALQGRSIIDLHDRAMILVAILASLPYM